MLSLKKTAPFLFWMLPAFIGFHVVFAHAAQPGAIAKSREVQWPSQSKLQPTAAPYTLLMFVHPYCPCTAASITELSILMNRCPEIKAYVVFIAPRGAAKDWEKGDLWNRVASLPGAQPVTDDCGHESINFGATTSGQTLLYDDQGKLRFAGGITGSRGHEGDNQGLSLIEEAVRTNQRVSLNATSVFGCELQDKNTLIAGAKP